MFGAGRKVLIAYLLTGDPSLKASCDAALYLSEAGADLIELGVPFSDPVADGPIIQKASQRALAQATTLAKILEIIPGLKEKLGKPLILMSYFNPIYRYGLERFVVDLKSAGGDGLIACDLPFEESEEMRTLLQDEGLAYIPLVAPTTPDQRLKNIADHGSGFIYCISRTGVTGPREDLPSETEDYLRRVRQATNLPLVVGFGVNRPEQAKKLGPLADGVVVGSAIVERVSRGEVAAAVGLVESLRKSLDDA